MKTLTVENALRWLHQSEAASSCPCGRKKQNHVVVSILGTALLQSTQARIDYLWLSTIGFVVVKSPSTSIQASDSRQLRDLAGGLNLTSKRLSETKDLNLTSKRLLVSETKQPNVSHWTVSRWWVDSTQTLRQLRVVWVNIHSKQPPSFIAHLKIADSHTTTWNFSIPIAGSRWFWDVRLSTTHHLSLNEAITCTTDMYNEPTRLIPSTRSHVLFLEYLNRYFSDPIHRHVRHRFPVRIKDCAYFSDITQGWFEWILISNSEQVQLKIDRVSTA